MPGRASEPKGSICLRPMFHSASPASSREGAAVTRLPWVKFWYQDWLGAPDLADSTLATQGAWMRALCRMWHDDAAELTRTMYEWSRFWDCDMSVTETVMEELEHFGICDISRDGDSVTLKSRRIEREKNKREQDALRKRRQRSQDGHADVTDDVTPDVTGRSSEANIPRGSNANMPNAKKVNPQFPDLLQSERIRELLAATGVSETAFLRQTKRRKASLDWVVASLLATQAKMNGDGESIRNPGAYFTAACQADEPPADDLLRAGRMMVDDVKLEERKGGWG